MTLHSMTRATLARVTVVEALSGGIGRPVLHPSLGLLAIQGDHGEVIVGDLRSGERLITVDPNS